MKSLPFLLFFVAAQAVAGNTSFSLSQAIHDNKTVPFVPHHGTKHFSNYLTMNIRFAPAKALFEQLNTQLGGRLKSRGEAHITVVTPPEFDDVLGKKLTMEDIDKIALNHHIQAVDFDVVCLGKGSAPLKGKKAETWYVVVKAPPLLAIRQDIAALFVKRGGAAADFDPNEFYPHITIGFDMRDLYISDGVVKDSHSCVAELKH